MRRAAKIDINQGDIVLALRRAGCTVFPTHMVGHGFPDIVVGRHDKNWLMEIKSDSGKLTPDERVFFADWRGQVCVVRSADEALKVVGLL